MKNLRLVLATLAFALFLPIVAQAGFVSSLSSVGSVGSSDLFYDCPGGLCDATHIGASASGLKIDQYILGTLGATAPLSYNPATGGMSITAAATNTLGAASCDGTTITCTSGRMVAVGGGGSVSITAGNAGITFSPSPLIGTGTASLNITGGGVTAHNWIASMTAAGVATESQPAFTDISGSASAAQMSTNLGAAVSTVCSGSTTNFVRGDGTCVAPSGSGLSGMTTGQVPIAASATTVTSSKALSNSSATTIATASGTLTNGHCVQINSTGDFVDAGGACTTGGGGGTVSSGTSGQGTYYTGTGTVVGGTSGLTLSSTKLTAASIALGSDATGDLYYNGGSGAFTRLPVGSANQLAGVISGLPAYFTLGGDCTIVTSTGIVTCTKTSGTLFGTFATANAATPPAIGGTTPAAASFTTLTTTGSQFVKTRVITSAAAVTVSSTTDYLVIVNFGTPTAEPINYTCSPGFTFIVKDGGGTDATQHLTLTPSSGTIDGASTYVMQSSTAATPPYEARQVTCDGSGNSWIN